MTRNYFFDMGGVLMDIDPNLTINALSFFLKNEPSDNGVLEAKDLFGVGDNELMSHYQDGSAGTDDFLATIMPLCQRDVSREQILQAWDAMLIDIPQERIDKLLQLREKGFGVYLLSNINEEHLRWTKERLLKLGYTVDDIFDKAFFSCEMGCSKPDSRIYIKAIEQSGVNPSETLYIDDMQVNIDAGHSFGLQTLCGHWDDFVRTILTSRLL